MPVQLSVPVDLTGAISSEALGAEYAELRARRVLLDAPARYW
jgi:hypothetical protein